MDTEMQKKSKNCVCFKPKTNVVVVFLCNFVSLPTIHLPKCMASVFRYST